MSKCNSVAIGDQFGHWTVISSRVGRDVACRCACGVEKPQSVYNLLNGKTKPCGCRLPIKPDKNSDHPLYQLWKGMNARCSSPNHKSYDRYGGRGITVCDRWKADFRAFVSDVGERPSKGHSLDRIDGDKGYSKENCRWATQTEQTRNTRRSVLVTIDGQSKTIAQWAEETGVPGSRIYKRVAAGITGAAAVFDASQRQAAAPG